MSPKEFIDKWKPVTTSERATAQSHFNDLCDLLGEPKPHDDDPTGERYAFEKGAIKSGGGDGWADVWRKGCFAWEYKGKHKDLEKALAQVKQYAAALQNPPLLVASDIERIIVITNWTNTVSVRHEIKLEELTDPFKLDFLRRVFRGDEKLRTGESRTALTAKVASKFANLAQELQEQGYEPLRVAHFVNRLVFCMFAEDAGLLTEDIFSKMLEVTRKKPSEFVPSAQDLFRAMSKGGRFGLQTIEWFNGGLFEDDDALPLTHSQIDLVRDAAKLDWSAIDPSIFGTLFERGLDPEKRSQLGAHYTDPENIMRIVNPVVLEPLSQEWDEAKAQIEKFKSPAKKKDILNTYLLRLRSVSVLDPACGSGNFLYLALRGLKDLELRVLFEAETLGLEKQFPQLDPSVLKGIELNVYAAELARVSIWIGELQWQIEHGFNVERNPVLKPLDSIENRDALLTNIGTITTWPLAEFIIGNPPFLGGSLLRRGLGHEYVDQLFAAFGDRIPNFSDLCCYWFEMARQSIENEKSKRVGLIATQGIRGTSNRKVLERIKETGDIFFAWSDLDWYLDGANVHVSIVGFDDGESKSKDLDGKSVHEIHSNLSALSSDSTQAKTILANMGVCFMGASPKAPFDIDENLAVSMLSEPNVHGFPNSDVVRPVVSAIDLTRESRELWTVDFGLRSYPDAVLYQKPFAHIEAIVKPIRVNNRRAAYAEKWWQYAEARSGMRAALTKLPRQLVTPGVSKHRIFRWYPTSSLCNQGTLVFARDDDFAFGLLQSRFHEIWALAQGTQLEDRPRYTPTTCFETFPFPSPTGDQEIAISEAAKELDHLRENWLNPVEWTRTSTLTFPATVGGPWHGWIPDTEQNEIGSVQEAHYIRKIAHPAMVASVAARTLTRLYNEQPAWLRNAHRKLDEAVADAYGLPVDIVESDLLAELLQRNLRQSK
jgi:type II restriction/modification system DNA methylase subunit YeeA